MRRIAWKTELIAIVPTTSLMAIFIRLYFSEQLPSPETQSTDGVGAITDWKEWKIWSKQERVMKGSLVQKFFSQIQMICINQIDKKTKKVCVAVKPVYKV